MFFSSPAFSSAAGGAPSNASTSNPFASAAAPFDPFAAAPAPAPASGAASVPLCTVSAPPAVTVTGGGGTPHYLSTANTAATSPFAPAAPTPATASLALLSLTPGAQSYCEASIGSLGTPIPGATSAAFGVGIVFFDVGVADVERTHMPGWLPRTIGLHSDDGRLFEGNGAAEKATALVAPFHAPGAIAGVGVFPTTAAAGAAGSGYELVFTVNGVRVLSRALAATADVIGRMKLSVGLLGSGVALLVNAGEAPFTYAPANARRVAPPAPPAPQPHHELVAALRSLPSAPGVVAACRKHGIACMSVAWEDAGRSKGSCWGPNISDMTLRAGDTNMPILRMPNFSDVTSDQDRSGFFLIVGNEAGGAKCTIPLSEYLRDIGKYIGDASTPSLLAPARDSKVLTAAQACILPLRDGRVEFNVALFNYQSASEPAVLVIVASSEGTSAQIVLGRENLLRFNKAGGASDYVAERLRDDRAKRGVALDGPMTVEEKKRNVLLIIQVPLKVARPAPPVFAFGGGGAVPAGGGFSFGGGGGFGGGGSAGSWGMAAPAAAASFSLCAPAPAVATLFSFSTAASRSRVAAAAPERGIDFAMLSTTDARGAFAGTQGRKLVRDDTMPIRCTFQYYHVTDTDDLSESVVAAIAGQVKELYDASAPWNRGSLVTGGASGRATEHTARAGGFVSSPAALPWYWGFSI